MRMFYLVENKAQGGAIARFRGGAEMDYLIQIFDELYDKDQFIAGLRGVRGINYIQPLDPLNSGAIEHLALLDLVTSEEH